MPIILLSVFIHVILRLGIKKSRFAMTLIFMITIIIPYFGIMSMEESETVHNIVYKISQVDRNIFSILLMGTILIISYFISLKLYNNKFLE